MAHPLMSGRDPEPKRQPAFLPRRALRRNRRRHRRASSLGRPRARADRTTPRIDAALVDVNLGGKPAYPVIDALAQRKIPFVLMSGYEAPVLRSRYPSAQNCQKPYEFADIKRTLLAARPA